MSQDVTDFDPTMEGAGAQQLLLTVAENLELENQALLRRDGSILTAVDHGDRLIDLQGRLAAATASGITTTRHYAFDDVSMSLLKPFGKQTGLSIGIHATGTVTEETYDAAGNLQSTTSEPFDQVFVTRRATGGRWLNVDMLPPPAGG